jgi:hypothetical protein
MNCLPGLTSNHDPSNLSIPSSEDYRSELPAPSPCSTLWKDQVGNEGVEEKAGNQNPSMCNFPPFEALYLYVFIEFLGEKKSQNFSLCEFFVFLPVSP